MQLETYISDLLYRYDCVMVPEFGAFISQRVSATVNNTTNAFYPPKKLLSFNEQIQTNDGLLARYIADVENISFEDALVLIAKEVTALKSLLTEGKIITFKHIGDLVFNSEGKIQFTPSYHLNYLTDAFGLSQFVSHSMGRETYTKEAEAIEKVIPIADTPKRRRARPYLKYAAVGVIALTLGGFGVANYYVNSVNTHNEIAQEEANQQLEHKIQEATFVISNPLPAVTLKVEKESGNYHIVAGAFRVEDNCDKKVEELKNEGFNARKIGVNKYGLHQVIYSSFSERRAAINALNAIKRSNNSSAWLLVKDLN
ncbi:SPOR domain-containing protein [Bizionia saleffrena]|uniref:SPOR domain-containing protein n=1 Tax=Bizionia saleffrena TaxID=291189 RepID=A0A8H2QJB4_9FLAO|nr:SPOR domain-containing protein [Bizionia saleffrena]TYB74236.1 SPOR domain-containing protein [Bizionia saleffrena]